MYKITIEEVKDYEIHFTKEDVRVISNITGKHYCLMHGETMGNNKQSYFTDIMFIMELRYAESIDAWVFDDNTFVSYLFGANAVYERDPDALQNVIAAINKYELYTIK